MSAMLPVTKAPPIRVWRLNDCDWVAARTLTEAIDCLCKITGISRAEAVDESDKPRALTVGELAKLTFVTDEEEDNVTAIEGCPVYKRHSFAVELQRRMDRGDEFPCYFASTEF